MSHAAIPLSVPNLAGRELEYVSDAIAAGWVSTAGAYVERFEDAIARFVGAPCATACQSGTAGLHVALQLMGVKAGDGVLVPALTFIASVNPVRYLGAEPIFMDCDDSLCMDPAKLEKYCSEECELRDGVLHSRVSGRPIRAVVVVHVFGNMADMDAIMRIAGRYNLKVIEDAAEALGTVYEEGPYAGRHAGVIGDVGVYSFNGNKLVTTGGGGMIVSGDERVCEHARHLTTQAKIDPVCYEHDEVGYNYRLTNLQAAVGVAQVEQVDGFIEAKNRNYELYNRLLAHRGLPELLPFREGVRSNRWFYSFPVPVGIDRGSLMEELGRRQVQTRPIWGLINEQPPYEGCEAYRVEVAPSYRKKVLNVPCSTSLGPEEIEDVVADIEGALELLAR